MKRSLSWNDAAPSKEAAAAAAKGKISQCNLTPTDEQTDKQEAGIQRDRPMFVGWLVVQT